VKKVTKLEQAKMVLGEANYDLAIPQQWADRVANILEAKGSIWGYREVVTGFVWLYDGASPIFGRPFPITYAGRRILMMIQDRRMESTVA
jgi:hypothetical protein